ncbi:MAG: hypothetical protein HKN33_18890 [Pyrinomonadaceae bacterium]|nr:hypothetical protein [Pyrinomonadaceae bacterium]
MRIAKKIAWFLVSSRSVQAFLVVHTILFVFLIILQGPFVLHGSVVPLASIFLFLIDLPAYFAATETLGLFTNLVPEHHIFSHEVLFGWTHVGVFSVFATLQWVLVGAFFEIIGRQLK